MQSFNLNLNDIFSALENNNQNTGGAYIEKGPTVLFIRSEGLIGSEDDINEIPVKATLDGVPILLKDVAEVKIGFATRYGAMTYNDQGEVAGAVVMMLKGANSNEVIKNVKERIAQIQKNLPEGVVIEPFLDRTKMVNNAIHTIEKKPRRRSTDCCFGTCFLSWKFKGRRIGGIGYSLINAFRYYHDEYFWCKW